MKVGRYVIDAGSSRASLWISASALAVGVGSIVAGELLDVPALQRLDEEVLVTVAEARVDWLNGAAVDLTALGSQTLVTLQSIVALVVLLLIRDRPAALQLVAASAGSAALGLAAKAFVHRPRPDLVPRLVEVSGFSYPSGHAVSAAAMYLTIGLLACRHLPSGRAQIALMAVVGVVVGGIASSRVYLGAHYPSDIVSGVSLGTAWAFFVVGSFALAERARALRTSRGPRSSPPTPGSSPPARA